MLGFWSDKISALTVAHFLSFSLFVSPQLHEHKKEVTRKHDKTVAICNAVRESSTDTNPVGTLLLDFQSSELWENKFPFKPPILTYFFMAAQSEK
jgi:hypothetical protein